MAFDEKVDTLTLYVGISTCSGFAPQSIVCLGPTSELEQVVIFNKLSRQYSLIQI
jgi:hypothetical protein